MYLKSIKLHQVCQYHWVTRRQHNMSSNLLRSQYLDPKLVRFKHKSASAVRSQFLDYFQSKDHLVVPSSPVVPFNDPSLSFVNAGMNQFKPVFQGISIPPSPRVANSQKCVRVGGKHNDLSVVGTDGTHLTMFEMLGSWSFGDYWKHEACKGAWELLTKELGLDSDKLWVTYFGGCQELGLEVDLETKEIWRMLGVPENRIIPLGMDDNFWEMGLAGPCGPCTEIHYNHTGVGGLEGATEVWNVVFMQFNKGAEGQLDPLAVRHVDTGMGLERITAIMNMDNISNTPDLYTTDLFITLFSHIALVSGRDGYSGNFSSSNALDLGYRVLADHARMLTVCLADGVIPDHNHKLRNVLRRAQTVCRDVFGVERGLLGELSFKVVETLGEHHSELVKNHQKVLTLLDFEDENMKKILEKGEKFKRKLVKEFPEVASSIETLDACNYYEALNCIDKELGEIKTIDGALAYKLYESCGMQKKDIFKLAGLSQLEFDQEMFDKYFAKQKKLSKLSTALLQNNTEEIHFGEAIPSTDDQHKYQYERSGRAKYKFPRLKTKILGLNSSGNCCSKLVKGEEGVLLTRETNFYSEAGGQVGDQGTVVGPGGAVFKVEDTQKLPSKSGHIAHVGVVETGEFSVNDDVELEVDEEHRFGCMRNHTATHLLNSVLNDALPITCQRSSYVSSDYLKFDFSVFNVDFDNEMVKRVEEKVQQLIDQEIAVGRQVLSVDYLADIDNLITLPGEIYPSEVSIIDISKHVEPCCGTHLLNTKDVGSFVVTSMKSPGSGIKSIKCITGEKALKSRRMGVEVLEEIISFQGTVERYCEEISAGKMKQILDKIGDMEQKIYQPEFPHTVSVDLSSVLDRYKRQIKVSQRAVQKGAAFEQLKVSISEQEDKQYFCHYITLTGTDKFSLSKAVNLVPKEKPSLIFSKVKGELKAKAVVPKQLVTDSFSAKIWLDVAARRLGAKTSAPKGQDSTVNCNMAGIKNIEEDVILDILQNLRLFVENTLES